MIRGDPCGDIGVQLLAAQSRGMTVDPFPLGDLDLFQDFGVAMDHSGKVHHLTETLYPFLIDEVFEVVSPDLCPCGLEKGGRHARGEHNEEVEGDGFYSCAHELNAFDPHDVGNLVKVGHHRRYPVGDDCLGIFPHPHHAALDMHMCVDEAGGEKFSLEVYYLLGGIIPEPHHDPLGDGDCL